MGTNRQVSCVKVDPADETIIWLGCSDSENNSGAPVTPSLVRVIRANGSTTGPPAGRPSATAFAGPSLLAGSYISNIDIEPGNSNHMILSVSNFGETSVWESTNGGTSWTSIEGNLPDMPVRWALFIPGGYQARASAIGGVILATELGVWSTNTLNGGSTFWVSNNSGLANVRTDHLVLRYSDKNVGAATHGRGVFTTTLLTTPLPVTLIQFTGRQLNDHILLEWKTASEYNSSHFELEKSEDGTHFRKIARVDAAGSSSVVLSYQFIDQQVITENNYYRLRSVDINNDSEMSNTILVSMKGVGQKLYVLGNPFKEKIRLRLFMAPQSMDLRLFGSDGKLVASRHYGPGQQLIDWDLPAGLTNGVYMLEAIIDGRRFTRKLTLRR
jgi:hypothetical protein